MGQGKIRRPLGPLKKFLCRACGRIIEVPYGVPKPMTCPYCGAPGFMIHRLNAGGRGGPPWAKG
ncbi:MAG: hypothetical protein B6U69_01735 [Thermofilum sp. ex4484_15]|nr:MAG: hypothetical protein B6U69_01735 [Thermofilum sp. ex4484_15]